MEVAEGVEHDGVRTYTLWGELAWQLGFHAGGATAAREAYEVVRKSDEQRTLPDSSLGKLIGDDPALLMIDEIADYLRVARGAIPSRQDQRRSQTVAFFMLLIKFASERKRTVLV